MSKQKDIYVIAQYYAKPKNPKMTRVPGYMTDEANIAWDERVDVTYGLRSKDLVASKVVINISKQAVEKDSFKSGRSFDELFSYFYSANPKQIANAIRQFGITIGQTTTEELPATSNISPSSENAFPEQEH